MSQVTVFVQTQGDGRVAEVRVAQEVTLAALREALGRAGVAMDDRKAVFIDEEEEALGDGDAVRKLKDGSGSTSSDAGESR